MKTITTPSGNRVSVNSANWRGRERIYYNDELVSDRFSLAGGTYFFEKKELGKIVQYEIRFGSRWNGTCFHEMRIDGKIFFSDR